MRSQALILRAGDEGLFERVERFRRNVGYRDISEMIVVPGVDVVSGDLSILDIPRAAKRRDADRMRPAAIDHGSDRLAGNDIDASADKRKSTRGEIDDRRRFGKLGREPRFHRVAVGRGYIERFICEQAADVIGYGKPGNFLPGGELLQPD